MELTEEQKYETLFRIARKQSNVIDELHEKIAGKAKLIEDMYHEADEARIRYEKLERGYDNLKGRLHDEEVKILSLQKQLRDQQDLYQRLWKKTHGDNAHSARAHQKEDLS